MPNLSQTIRKVPEITIYFWLIKILTTAMGEATSDFLISHLNPYFAVILGFLCFIIILIVQIYCRKYLTWIYWLTVAMVAVFGTMAADVFHVVFNVPYIITALMYALVLAILFFTWFKIEKTLSVHSIYTRKRELFYWACVLATFALGTAVGDLSASTFNLGYLMSGVIFTILFIVPFLAKTFVGLNSVTAFWLSYILTRPLGASFADWASKPYLGGIGLGDGKVALFLICVFILLVGYVSTIRIENKYNYK